MARKILANSINALRRADENIFMMPLAVRGPSKPKPVNIKAVNLQPNTRYKVLLDNYPGNEFEDITDFCEPIGDSIKQNTHKVGRGRWIYFKSNADGVLELSVRSYGTDEATYTGSSGSGSDFTNLWKYGENRARTADRGRDKIKFIAYTYIANPTSNAKIKSLKVDVASETLDTEGALDPLGDKGSARRPQKSLEDALPKGVICDCTLTPIGNPRRPAPVKANLYQTFYVSSAAVRNGDTVDLLDITLYFRSKPPIKSNSSGKYAPGVYITMLECDKKGVPIITHRISGASRRLPWHSIKVSSNATDGSIFTFARPITLKTNSYYAVAISMEDNGYALWENIKGNYAVIDGVKTEKISPGSSKGHQGQLFYYNGFAKNSTKSNGWQARPDLDIKFDTHMAEYATGDITVKLVNDDYEFFALSNTQPKWAPGEIVYKDGPLPTRPGVVSITAGSKRITGDVSTDFGDLATGNKIVVIDSTDNTKRQVFTVDKTATVNNNTIIYVDEFAKQTMSGSYKLTVIGYVDDYDYYFKSLRLSKSSVTRDGYVANSNMLFEVGDIITGVETGTEGYISAFEPQPMSVFRSDWNAKLPAEYKPVTTYNLSYDDGGTYRLAATDRVFYLNAPNHVKDYEGLILSTSQEIVQTDTEMVNNDYKSAEINLTYQYKAANTKTYSSPSLRVGEMNVVTHNWYINNNGDNEHLNEGNAITRHISKTLELGSSSKAEDLRVVLNAYRPLGTGIDVYAKVQSSQDSDAFEDKQWTKLVPITGRNSFSDKEKQFDYREMEFTFADYPEANTTLSGSYEVNGNNNIILGTGFSNNEIDALSAGDVIRVYSELFPNTNYTLLSVAAANGVSGEITYSGETIANNSHIGTGFKIDTLRAEEAAFRNPNNFNICSYFNGTGAVFDTYNKIAIKIVLLAESRKLVPKVDDYRVIAVSA